MEELFQSGLSSIHANFHRNKKRVNLGKVRKGERYCTKSPTLSRQKIHSEMTNSAHNMNPEQVYSKLVKALTKNLSVVQPIGKKGFGRNALYFRGRIFAFLSHRRQLALRIEPQRVSDLVALGAGMY